MSGTEPHPSKLPLWSPLKSSIATGVDYGYTTTSESCEPPKPKPPKKNRTPFYASLPKYNRRKK